MENTLKICLLSLVVTLTVEAHAQFGNKRMRGVEVAETGFSILVDSSSIKSQSIQCGEIQLEITPIDPVSLNKHFTYVATFDGRFSYNYYDLSRDKYFFKRKRPKKAKVKSDEEMLLEGAEWLLENDILNEDGYTQLYQDILSINDSVVDKDENLGLSRLNPYNMGTKHLTVFRVVLKNETNVPQKLEKMIQLRTNNTLVDCLTSSKILAYQRKNTSINDSEILDRYNFSGHEVVPPKSTIMKYMAFLPVNFQNPSFDLFITGNNASQKLSWDLKVKKDVINETYFYYELYISLPFSSMADYEYLDVKSNADIYIDGNVLYVNKTDITEPIEAFYFTLSSMGNLFYSTMRFKASDYLDFDKNKRASVKPNLEEIKSIKRKK